MKIRLFSLIAVMALSVGMMAAPASAAANQVVVFAGTATVCASGTASNPACNPQGGLELPSGTSQYGSYAFSSSTACQVVGGGACAIGASGALAPVAGIGAACGLSHGHSGTGTLAPGGYTISNLGWAASAGGTLPVTGTYTDGTDTGPVAGVVQAQGGADCISPSGASNFNVVGVVAAL